MKLLSEYFDFKITLLLSRLWKLIFNFNYQVHLGERFPAPLMVRERHHKVSLVRDSITANQCVSQIYPLRRPFGLLVVHRWESNP